LGIPPESLNLSLARRPCREVDYVGHPALRPSGRAACASRSSSLLRT